MPKYAAIDVSVRPMPAEIASRYHRLDEYRHIFETIFKRPEVLERGIPLEDMVAQMDAGNVASIVVSGYDARRSTGLFVENDWVGDLAHRLPGRIVCGVGVDPLNDIMSTLDEIERCAERYDARLVRLFPYAAALRPDDRRFYPIYAKCCEHDLAVWTQVGHTAGLMPSEPGRPIHLDRVALDFPALRIIGGHIGWPWESEMIAMALKHPNVYVSTCAHAPDHWPSEFLKFMKTRGRRKVLFGSNWPYIDFTRYFRHFEALGLDDETERLFLCENARRVLRMTNEAHGDA
ncbi:MAG: amidohydrolase [Rhodocyclaceae bacterium]|nr:amidohydrolase [Rhodocyclaceae bacterium]